MRWLALIVLFLVPPTAFAQKVAHAPEPDTSSMVEFTATTYSMGEVYVSASAYGDAWYIDQQPSHDVTLSAFWLDATEVTVSDFAQFLTYAAGAYHFHPDQPIEKVADGYLPVDGRDDEPISHVTWEAAHHYCLWAGKRLPTEAEWEYAAAGNEGRIRPWGDDGASCSRANYFTGSTHCEEGPVDVGSRPEGATPDGVLDLAGNVAEWVADYYDFYTSDPQTDPTGPSEGIYRVVRGGGYLEEAQTLRSHARRGADPILRSSNIGFRCAYDSAPDDGAIRGDLTAPDDADREPTDRPLAPSVDLPTVLAQLVQPVAMLQVDGSIYVLDRAQGAIFEIDGATVSSLVDGFDRPWDMCVDEALGMLYVTERDTGEVIVTDVSGAGGTVLATGQTNPGRIVCAGSTPYWSTDDGIMTYTTDVELLADVTGITDLFETPEHLYFTSTGGSTPADSMTGRIPLDGSPLEVLDTYGADFYPTIILWEYDSSRAFVMHRKRAWPADGHISQWAEGMPYPITFAYTPTSPTRALWQDGDLVFATQYTLGTIQVGVDTTYHSVHPWTRASSLIEHDGALVWADSQDGRIYSL